MLTLVLGFRLLDCAANCEVKVKMSNLCIFKCHTVTYLSWENILHKLENLQTHTFFKRVNHLRPSCKRAGSWVAWDVWPRCMHSRCVWWDRCNPTVWQLAQQCFNYGRNHFSARWLHGFFTRLKTYCASTYVHAASLWSYQFNQRCPRWYQIRSHD